VDLKRERPWDKKEEGKQTKKIEINSKTCNGFLDSKPLKLRDNR